MTSEVNIIIKSTYSEELSSTIKYLGSVDFTIASKPDTKATKPIKRRQFYQSTISSLPKRYFLLRNKNVVTDFHRQMQLQREHVASSTCQKDFPRTFWRSLPVMPVTLAYLRTSKGVFKQLRMLHRIPSSIDCVIPRDDFPPRLLYRKNTSPLLRQFRPGLEQSGNGFLLFLPGNPAVKNLREIYFPRSSSLNGPNSGGKKKRFLKCEMLSSSLVLFHECFAQLMKCLPKAYLLAWPPPRN